MDLVKSNIVNEEKKAKTVGGMGVLIAMLAVVIIGILGFVYFAITGLNGFKIALIVLIFIYLIVGVPIICSGLKVIKPNEALVLSLFGKYYGTIREDGYYFVNPFCTSVSQKHVMEGAIELFNDKKKLQTDHIDFYLVYALNQGVWVILKDEELR
ncbi:MAG: hypothetical protein LBN09_07815 [Clostridioides sp.]|nr:hypothetical protein [Clostridioides sp.]